MEKKRKKKVKETSIHVVPEVFDSPWMMPAIPLGQEEASFRAWRSLF